MYSLHKNGTDHLLSEIAVEVKSTTDSCEVWEANAAKLGVVGDLKTTANSLELWEGDVGQLLVAYKRERAANGRKVWCGDVVELVAVEAERAVQRRKRWNVHAGAVAEGHVERPLEVREDSLHHATIRFESKSGSDVAKLHSNVLEVVVVCDHDFIDHLQVDAIERAKICIGDRQSVHLLHTSSEREALQSRKCGPVDSVDCCQPWEVQCGQNSQAAQAEGVGDGL